MGCGTGPFDRPSVFRVIVAFTESDGVTRKRLDRNGEIYRQFIDSDKGLKNALLQIGVHADWQEASDGDQVLGGTLLLRGTFRNVIQDGRIAVIHDGDISYGKAGDINCAVDHCLSGMRTRVVKREVKGKQKTIRQSTGVAGVVVDNVGPAANDMAPVGTAHGACGEDPDYEQICCQPFRISSDSEAK